MEQNTWADRLTEQIGQNIKRRRESLSLSAEQVSTAATAMGLNISRQMITNLETGRRASLSVAELAVIAEALQVEPVALLYPPTELTRKVEYLPGQEATAVEAYIKFCALSPLHRDQLQGERSDQASAYQLFIEALNNDAEIEELEREIERTRSGDKREVLEMKMKALLIMALIIRRSIPSGHEFPAAPQFLIGLWREYLDESEFLDLAGAVDSAGATREASGS